MMVGNGDRHRPWTRSPSRIPKDPAGASVEMLDRAKQRPFATSCKALVGALTQFCTAFEYLAESRDADNSP